MTEIKGIDSNMIAGNLVPAVNIHPGEVIREELEFRGISQRELSRRISVSPTIINEMLKGKRQLSTELALLIGAALDIDAEPLIQMQCKYNIYEAKNDPVFSSKIKSVESLSAVSYSLA